MALSQWLGLGAGADPDADLVRKAKGGSQSAFDALRRNHDKLLGGFVARRVGSASADDIVQDIWIACWKAMPQFAGKAKFKVWLYGIAAHKCTDSIRSKIVERSRTAESLPEEIAAPDQYKGIDLRSSVQSALQTLPDDQREVLELYFYAELTLAEIAKTLNRNLNTVKYQFYRSHQLVAAEIKAGEKGF